MTPSTYYTQGLYTPIHRSKYTGTFPIVYRSRPEYMMCRWMDINENVLAWASESSVIHYRKPTDNKIHRYFVDFSCKFKDKAGQTVNLLIEYKPSKFLKKPEPSKRQSQKTYINLCETWLVNQAKWNAAKEYAKSKNAKFIVVTEKEIGLNP